jgi:peptide/nickel transport system permease protein
MIQASVTIGFAILMTAGLSFVGAGVRPPTPEWGLMIAAGADGIVQAEWWPSVFPGIAISITVFGYAAFGNGLERRHAR